MRTRIQIHFDRESLVELRENEMKLMVEKVALLRKRAPAKEDYREAPHEGGRAGWTD